ncbi:MAG TPA: FecR domain-containing protein [Chloroflexia bacterium]|nr:FecR domain-containing protein [Chloroflexia bacterium]
MSQEPSSLPPPPESYSPPPEDGGTLIAPPPRPNRRPVMLLVVAGGLLLLLLFLLLPGSWLGGSPSPGPASVTGTVGALPGGTVAATPAGPTPLVAGGTIVPASPVTGTVAAGAPGPPAATPALTGTVAGGLSNPLATLVVRLPDAQPSAPAVLSGTVSPAASGAAELPGLTVIDASGGAFACARSQGCAGAASAGQAVYPGGEARTTAGGGVRLQAPAGVVSLAADTLLRVGQVDDRQTGLTLMQGRLLARAAAGRQSQFAVTAGASTVQATGSSFGVAVLPSGDTRVSVPADAGRPAQVRAGASDVTVAPGMSVTVSASGVAGTPAALDASETSALTTLGAPVLPGPPGAVAQVTELPVPSVGPFAPGVVTATVVLTPPPEHTLIPLTVLAVGQPTPLGGGRTGGTPGVGIGGVVMSTPGAGAASGTPAGATTGVTLGPADLLAAVVQAMGTTASYNFGATRGLDPVTAEFSAGTVAGDTVCWITTAAGTRTDYQLRGGVLFQRSGTGPWQQQSGSGAAPAWVSYWKLLGQVEPATAREVPAAQMDAVPVRHIQARLATAAGQPANTWIAALVGADDHLVRSLVLSDAEPGAGRPIFKMGLSSLGAALACPPLSP